MKICALTSLVLSAPVENDNEILPVIIGGTEVFIEFRGRQVFLLPLFFLLPLSISTAVMSDSTAAAVEWVS